MGPAEMGRAGMYVWKDRIVNIVSITYYSMNTRDRQSQTVNGLSYKLSQYTPRTRSSYSRFSANRKFLLRGSNVTYLEYLADGDNVFFHRAPGFEVI